MFVCEMYVCGSQLVIVKFEVNESQSVTIAATKISKKSKNLLQTTKTIKKVMLTSDPRPRFFIEFMSRPFFA